ncbi:MAG TPA: dTDP-glucose 4,6-dehydratase [Gemmatimonadaceae bacterium]|nr:dTDP-glucose 4,6-dehydratase [Gemmatimonadaceae bacterium]
MTAAAPTPPFRPRAVLVTGGAGFIGARLVRWLLREVPDVHVVTLDALTYAGRRDRLAGCDDARDADDLPRHRFVRGDVRDAALVARLLAGERDADGPLPLPDAVVHLAAETHVDRSIIGPGEFVSTNVQGTQVLLDAARRELDRRPRPFRFVHVSTDEVYGALEADEAPFTEEHPLLPNSPYAASKAGADCLVRAYVRTYGLPCVVVRPSNSYGPYQFPEKLVPLMATRALRELPLPVYGDGLHVREWLHVDDTAQAIWAACVRGSAAGRVYNVGGGPASAVANLALVRAVLAELGKPESLIRFVADRPGHDRRYALDVSRATAELGWAPRRTLAEGLRETVRWYADHPEWWEGADGEAYRAARALYLGAGE